MGPRLFLHISMWKAYQDTASKLDEPQIIVIICFVESSCRAFVYSPDQLIFNVCALGRVL